MWKPIINIILLILLVSSVTATPIRIKADCMDDNLIADTLNSIPDKYYQGLRFIRFSNAVSEIIDGFYYFSKGIVIYNSCSKDLDYLQNNIMHELAHHCQLINGDSYLDLMQHDGIFNQCLELIHNEI